MEPERYELQEASTYSFPLQRREFLKLAGGGVLVVLLGPSAFAQRTRASQDLPEEVSGWLHIDSQGAVSVFTGKAEVGQNIRTSLAQAVAEELRIPLDSIKMIMADTDRTPYDRGTFGSRTTPYMAPQLRRAAAAAREVLLELAAERWKTETEGLRIEDGAVTDPKSGRKLSLGELTQEKQIDRAISAVGATLTDSSQWKVLGNSHAKVNGREFVTGKHRFTTDLRLPNLHFGKVLRPPAYGARLLTLDDQEARRIEGVRIIRDGDFVGVTAPDPERAEQAANALNVRWETVTHPSDDELFRYLEENSDFDPAQTTPELDQAFNQSRAILETTYTVPYIAHVPLEPRAAVAHWENGRLTVWTGTQRPFGVRSELAGAFGLAETKVRVIVPDTGSGYGGKHTGEAAVEAARLARDSKYPVKLVWTRKEEFTWAYFRPAGVIRVRSGVSREGKLLAWDFQNINSGSAGIESPYLCKARRIEFHRSDSPLRQGSYRALAATANHFARESHLDEIALSVGVDPLDFRLKNLDDERLLAVLRKAAETFDWSNREKKERIGHGIAAGTEKGSYVANCVTVRFEPSTRQLEIEKIVTAYECGAIVNPRHLENQVEGAVLMGLGGALYEAIRFRNGQILNPRLSLYRVPRFSDVPELQTVLINRADLPSAGAGETPIIAIAPALANAIFDATGERCRSLPLRDFHS